MRGVITSPSPSSRVGFCPEEKGTPAYIYRPDLMYVRASVMTWGTCSTHVPSLALRDGNRRFRFEIQIARGREKRRFEFDSILLLPFPSIIIIIAGPERTGPDPTCCFTCSGPSNDAVNGSVSLYLPLNYNASFFEIFVIFHSV